MRSIPCRIFMGIAVPYKRLFCNNSHSSLGAASLEGLVFITHLIHALDGYTKCLFHYFCNDQHRCRSCIFTFLSSEF
jgi:hypothetical protein